MYMVLLHTKHYDVMNLSFSEDGVSNASILSTILNASINLDYTNFTMSAHNTTYAYAKAHAIAVPPLHVQSHTFFVTSSRTIPFGRDVVFKSIYQHDGTDIEMDDPLLFWKWGRVNKHPGLTRSKVDGPTSIL